MNTPEFIAYHEEFTKACLEIVKKKNHDYTASFENNAFANFVTVEMMGVASTEQGFLTRMIDKFMRISTFVKRGTLKVEDEKIEDTLRDLVNYVILLSGYIHEKKNNNIVSLKPTTITEIK